VQQTDESHSQVIWYRLTSVATCVTEISFTLLNFRASWYFYFLSFWRDIFTRCMKLYLVNVVHFQNKHFHHWVIFNQYHSRFQSLWSFLMGITEEQCLQKYIILYMIKDLKVGVIHAIDSSTEWTLAAVTENFIHYHQMSLDAQKSHIENVFMWVTNFHASLGSWYQTQCL
jgi:hypothetical protein